MPDQGDETALAIADAFDDVTAWLDSDQKCPVPPHIANPQDWEDGLLTAVRRLRELADEMRQEADRG